ncbi:phage tail tape measure protein, partial [Escherichia coli]|nr:phage tail tape measure protein [Escherichia coli]
DFMINHLTSEADVVNQLAEAEKDLAAEKERLIQMQEKSTGIQSALKNIEEQRVFLIRQQASEQNKAHQALLFMNAEQTKFNQIMNIGNNMLATRQALVNIPMRIPNA